MSHIMSDRDVIQKDTHKSIGIDIGGTNTRVGSFQTLARPDFTLLARFPTQQSYERQIEMIGTAVKNARSKAEVEVGAGVSIGGRVAQDGRSIVFAPNMTDCHCCSRRSIACW